ncbi:MAG: tryptophan 7-halogenase [Pseudomonadota bacterium]
MPADYDVAIIGGGPAGTAAALTLLKRDDLKVLVLERGEYAAPKVGESLSPGVRSLFQYLGVWTRFESEQRLQLLGSEAAWGSDELGAMDFILTVHGAGWALDRAKFDRMLASEVSMRGGEMRTGCSAGACEHDGEVWRIGVGGDSTTARFLIDAAGRTSAFSLAHGACRQRNDSLTAAAARLPRGMGGPHMTRVEAVEEGWWYAAPLPDGEVVVGLFTDAERLHASRCSDPEVWWRELLRTKHILPLIDREADPRELEMLPAFSALLTGANAEMPMVAAGDAAAARDPLSSSGIPNAIGSGIQAARVAADWLFGSGELKSAYLNSMAMDHAAYLKTHWKTYRAETRWPDAPFWRFRTAQIQRTPDVPVHARVATHSSLFVPKRVARRIVSLAEQPIQQADLVSRASQEFPEVPDERLILAVEDLTRPAPG